MSMTSKLFWLAFLDTITHKVTAVKPVDYYISRTLEEIKIESPKTLEIDDNPLS